MKKLIVSAFMATSVLAGCTGIGSLADVAGDLIGASTKNNLDKNEWCLKSIVAGTENSSTTRIKYTKGDKEGEFKFTTTVTVTGVDPIVTNGSLTLKEGSDSEFTSSDGDGKFNFEGDELVLFDAAGKETNRLKKCE